MDSGGDGLGVRGCLWEVWRVEPGGGGWERGDVVVGEFGFVGHAVESDVGVVGGVSMFLLAVFLKT